MLVRLEQLLGRRPAHAARHRLRHRATRRGVRCGGIEVTGRRPQRRAARPRRASVARTSSSSPQDMTALDLGDARFDAVTCLFDSIGYPQTQRGAVIATLGGGAGGTSPRRARWPSSSSRARDDACTPRRCACGAGTPAAASWCGSPRPARPRRPADARGLRACRARPTAASSDRSRAPGRTVSSRCPEMGALMGPADSSCKSSVPAYRDAARSVRTPFMCSRWRAAGDAREGRGRAARAGSAVGRRLHIPGEPGRGVGRVSGETATSSSSTPAARPVPARVANAGEPPGARFAQARPPDEGGAGARARHQARERPHLVRAFPRAGAHRPRMVRDTVARRTAAGLPFVFTVWDLEYLEQPWFPEVSADGEWELRDVFYSRYVPGPPGSSSRTTPGAEQLMRHFHVGPERVLVLPHPDARVRPPGCRRGGPRRPARPARAVSALPGAVLVAQEPRHAAPRPGGAA